MLIFTEHFRQSTSICRTVYSCFSRLNYLPVRVISFAVFLARFSVSLHEIAHTRANLPTYYEEKKTKIKTSTSTLKEPISSRSEKYNKFGDFSKKVSQKKIVFTRSCFSIPSSLTVNATYCSLSRTVLHSTITTLIFLLVSQIAPPIKTARAINHVFTSTSPSPMQTWLFIGLINLKMENR